MIRNIKEKDLSRCLEIYNEYVENTVFTLESVPLTVEEFKERFKRITASYPWLVAEENGVVAGYAYLDAFNPRDGYCYTCDLSIYVSSESRNHGIGNELYTAIEKEALRMGMVCIISLITDENEASIAFHEKREFVLAGTLPHVAYKHNRWLGVVFYQKFLTQID